MWYIIYFSLFYLGSIECTPQLPWVWSNLWIHPHDPPFPSANLLPHAKKDHHFSTSQNPCPCELLPTSLFLFSTLQLHYKGKIAQIPSFHAREIEIQLLLYFRNNTFFYGFLYLHHPLVARTGGHSPLLFCWEIFFLALIQEVGHFFQGDKPELAFSLCINSLRCEC